MPRFITDEHGAVAIIGVSREGLVELDCRHGFGTLSPDDAEKMAAHLHSAARIGRQVLAGAIAPGDALDHLSQAQVDAGMDRLIAAIDEVTL